MILHHVRLNNYGVYRGVVDMGFPMVSNRNVYLIDGNNGFGKSTLFSSILFALYGAEDGQQRIDSINRQSLRDGIPDCSVELMFDHDGNQYQLTRSIVQGSTSSIKDIEERVTLLKAGIPQKLTQQVIDSILPKEASQFFFFDGTEIRKYVTLENTKETRNAIELVLGLPAYVIAGEQVTTIRKDFQKKQFEFTQQNKELKEVGNRLREATDHLAQVESAIDETVARRDIVEKKLGEIQSELLRLEDTKNIQSRRDQLKTEIKQLEGRLSDLEDDIQKYIGSATLMLLKGEFEKYYKGLNGRITEQNSKVADISRLRERHDFIQELVDSQICLCGKTLDENDLAIFKSRIDDLEEQIRARENKTEDLGLRRKVEDFTRVKGIFESLEGVDSLKEKEKKRQETLYEIDQSITELDDLAKRLQETKVGEVSDLIEEQRKLDREFGELTIMLEEQKREKDDVKVELVRHKREMDRLGADNEHLSELNKKVDFIDRLKECMETILDRLKAEKARVIETEATKVFRILTNAPESYDHLKINDDYTISLFDHNGNECKRSTISMGEKQIVALSFILGLMNASEHQAFLMMDTPFGNLDLTHRKNLLSNVPKFGSQLIMFITDADIPRDYTQLIDRNIAKKYAIVYDQIRMASGIEEA